jgi:hypothetical protein|tara:strand:- start:1502 stop:1834 length:333 start_codon:yes stop_codon:yes gene_type:complete
MALTRQERLSIHKKQERLQVRSGVPYVSELTEGVPVLRSTSEGIVEYIRYNGVLYKNIFSRSGDVRRVPDYTTTNVTTDRTFNANSTSEAELADVLGTLIADLTSIGLLQ